VGWRSGVEQITRSPREDAPTAHPEIRTVEDGNPRETPSRRLGSEVFDAMKSQGHQEGAAPKRTRSALVVLALGLLVLGLLVAGCGGGGTSSEGGSANSSAKPKQGGTLRVTQGEEITELNPLTALIPADINITSNIVETLFKENFEGKLVPWLAEKYETNKANTVWTLQLKPGIKFSNGKPLTSEDVIFSLEQVRKSPIWEGVAEPIASVTAPSPTTVVIKTSRPTPEIPVKLSQLAFSIVPKDFGGETEKEFGQDPIGTGPFKFVSWKRGEGVTLAKNPDYWVKDRPYLDKIEFTTVEDPNSRVSQLQSDNLDLIYAPPPQQVESLESSPETEVGTYALGFCSVLIPNVRKPEFQNIKVREAISYAIDRQGLLDVGFNGVGKPAGAYLSPPIPGFNASIKAPEQDTEKAKELLAEAVKEGVQPSFTILVANEVPFWTSGVQVVQQTLNEIGFNVKIQKADSGTAIAKAGEGEFDMFASFNYEASLSPAEAFSFYTGTEGNFSGASTTEMEKLYIAAQATVDTKERNEAYGHMQQIIDEEKNVITVDYFPYQWAFRSNVTGFYMGRVGVAWFAETGFTE
jgi:peptide/nickel transport system substrate-binding protein